MNFREATDGIPAEVIAERLGVTPQTVRQYRLTPGSVGYRTPPANWRQVVRAILLELGSELHGRAAVLERAESSA